MATPEEGLLSIGPFPEGVNNIDSEADLPPGSLREALNIDLARDGWPKRRKGYTKRATLTDGHSLFSNGRLHLVVSGGNLSLVNMDDISLSSLAPVVGEVVCEDVLGTVYYSDGAIIAKIMPDGTHREAWVPNPAGRPTVAVSGAGSLPAGKYQVAITYVASDGEESGTDIADQVELTSDGGITLTNIPQDARAAFVRIYLTADGGEMFYRQLDLAMGLTSFTITTHQLGKELETQFAETLLPGNILCHNHGVLYVATSDRIYWSLPLRFGLTRRMDNYFPDIGGPARIIMAHSTGLFVATDYKTFFFSGRDPEKMTVNMVYPHGAVAGTGAQIPSSVLGIEYPGNTPVWFSDNGYVAGLPDGGILPLTEQKLAVGTYDGGATLYREDAGMRSIVTSLQAEQQANQLVTSDSVSFEVRGSG